ncbi:hypothetical protein [Halovivax cerinus]|uniref:Uncharacterized protein n=1 Tax=Halovivax cerinus TaxID=1487865 RepID=A0ABD5NJG1_9EURY|nr:hypothetical protein [Halovivax cerinus]
MKSIGSSGAGSPETPRNEECYRCDRAVAPAFLFKVSVEPSSGLSKKYGNSVRYCCEHCAAAMNLSDFSHQWTQQLDRG